MNDSDNRSVWHSVFDDPEMAEDLRKRSDVLIRILVEAGEKKISKARLKDIANLNFLECNALYRGDLAPLSLERLKGIASNAGFDVERPLP